MPLAWALVNLSNAYRFLGEIDKSLAAATESLAQFEGALGANHFATIHPLASIAYAKAVRGDADAEAFIRAWHRQPGVVARPTTTSGPSA